MADELYQSGASLQMFGELHGAKRLQVIKAIGRDIDEDQYQELKDSRRPGDWNLPLTILTTFNGEACWSTFEFGRRGRRLSEIHMRFVASDGDVQDELRSRLLPILYEEFGGPGEGLVFDVDDRSHERWVHPDLSIKFGPTDGYLVLQVTYSRA